MTERSSCLAKRRKRWHSKRALSGLKAKFARLRRLSHQQAVKREKRRWHLVERPRLRLLYHMLVKGNGKRWKRSPGLKK